MILQSAAEPYQVVVLIIAGIGIVAGFVYEASRWIKEAIEEKRSRRR